MKKHILFILTAVLLCLSIAGCGNKKNAYGTHTNEINLKADLKIEDSIIDEFDSEKYIFEEFRTLVRDEVAEFNSVHGADSIVINTITDEKETVTLQMSYATPEIYMAYHAGELEERGGSEIIVGLLQDADPSLLEGEFINGDGNSVNLVELSSGSGKEYRYIYVDFEAVLFGDGKLVAYTKGTDFQSEGQILTVENGDKVLAVYRD